MVQVAETLARVLGAPVKAVHVSPEEAIAAGQSRGWVNSQQWIAEVGYGVDLEQARSLGIVLTPLLDWAAAHADVIGYG